MPLLLQRLRATVLQSLPPLRYPIPAPQSRCPLLLLCKTGRRRPLLRRRAKLSAKQRKRKKYQDIPARLEGVTPTDPEFEGRLMAELGGANGPLQLSALILQFGPDLTPSHLAVALSRLAGFAASAAGGGGLPPAETATVFRTARRCAAVLRYKADQLADPLQAARATYALGRLGVYDRALCEAVVAATFDRLDLLPAEGLSALVSGFGSVGHAPPSEWLERLCLESYASMQRFNGPELANLLHALMRMRTAAAEQEAFAQRRSSSQHASTSTSTPVGNFPEVAGDSDPGSVKSISNPDGSNPSSDPANTTAAITAAIPSAPFLASALRCFPASFGTSCTAPALAKFAFAAAHLGARPSFNTMAALCAEARRLIDMFTARELAALLWACVSMGHTPDAIFMETWFRTTTRRLPSMDVAPLLLLLETLVATSARKGGLPLPQRFQDALLQQIEVQVLALHPSDLSRCFVSLIRLRVKPSEAWMSTLEASLETATPHLSMEALTDVFWSLGRLRYQPCRSCSQALVARAGALVVQGTVSGRQAGLLLWGAEQAEMRLPASGAAALRRQFLERAVAEQLPWEPPSSAARERHKQGSARESLATPGEAEALDKALLVLAAEHAEVQGRDAATASTAAAGTLAGLAGASPISQGQSVDMAGTRAGGLASNVKAGVDGKVQGQPAGVKGVGTTAPASRAPAEEQVEDIVSAPVRKGMGAAKARGAAPHAPGRHGPRLGRGSSGQGPGLALKGSGRGRGQAQRQGQTGLATTPTLTTLDVIHMAAQVAGPKQ